MTQIPETPAPCTGAEDPRERCGRHHETHWPGGTSCCCDQPWATTECSSGAADGSPVSLREQVHAVLLHVDAEAGHDVRERVDAVMEILERQSVAAVDPDEFDRYHITIEQDRDGSGVLELTCPRPDCYAVLMASSDAVGITSGDLTGLIVAHEAERHGGYQPIACQIVDTPHGPVKVQADGPVPPELGAALGDLAAVVQATHAGRPDPHGIARQALAGYSDGHGLSLNATRAAARVVNALKEAGHLVGELDPADQRAVDRLNRTVQEQLRDAGPAVAATYLKGRLLNPDPDADPDEETDELRQQQTALADLRTRWTDRHARWTRRRDQASLITDVYAHVLADLDHALTKEASP